MTLAFLGWQDEAAADAIVAATFAARPERGAAPLLTPSAVRPLPPRDPRLFALDLEDEGAARARCRRPYPSARGGWLVSAREAPFLAAHHPGARQAGERRVPPLPDDPPAPGEPFVGERLTLYRSTLRPQGALYEPLAQAPAASVQDQ